MSANDASTHKRARWSVLALLATAILINSIDRGILSTAAPLLKNELSLTTFQLGILFSAFFWSYTALQLVSGWIVDRFEVTFVLAAGFFVWSSATSLTGLVHGFAFLLAARLAIGVGESVAVPAFSKILARDFPEQRRGFANSLIIAGMTGGPALGTLAGGLLMASYGWRPVFVILGIVSLVWLYPWLRLTPRSQPAVVQSAHRGPGMLEILRQRSAWGTCLGQFCGNYLWYFLLTWLPYYLVHDRNFSIGRMAKVAAAVYISATVFSAASGWLSDRLISGGAEVTRVRKGFVTVGHLCAGFSMLWCIFADSNSLVISLLLCSASFGIFASNIWPITQTIAGPDAAGKWTGLQNFVANLAGVVVPALTGLIAEKSGRFSWAIVLTAAIVLLGALPWLFIVGPVRPLEWESEGRIHT